MAIGLFFGCQKKHVRTQPIDVPNIGVTYILTESNIGTRSVSIYGRLYKSGLQIYGAHIGQKIKTMENRTFEWVGYDNRNYANGWIEIDFIK